MNHRSRKEETFDDSATDVEAEMKPLTTADSTPVSPTNSTVSSSSGSSSTSLESGEIREESCLDEMSEADHKPDSTNAAAANGPHHQRMQQPPVPGTSAHEGPRKTVLLGTLESYAAMADNVRSINNSRYKVRTVRPNLDGFLLKRVPDTLPPPSVFLKPSKLHLLPNLGEPQEEPQMYANLNTLDDEDVASFFKEKGVDHVYERRETNRRDVMNLYPEVVVTKETPQGIVLKNCFILKIDVLTNL